MKKNLAVLGVLAIPFAALLSGCSVANLVTDGYDQSVEKTAETSEEGVASGLLPSWVPAGGTNVQLMQRSTGNERLLVMDYDADLPHTQCTAIANVGKPTDEELSTAYATDERTKNAKLDDMVTYNTLEADWWPENGVQQTSALCGRWWVHLSDGKLYAFAPDRAMIAEKVLEERKSDN